MSERALGVRVAGRALAIPGDEVLGVLADRRPSPAPTAPGFLLGAVVHRGSVVAVVDVPTLLEMAEEDGPAEPAPPPGAGDAPSPGTPAVVVVRTAAGPLALAVDAVEGEVEARVRRPADDEPGRVVWPCPGGRAVLRPDRIAARVAEAFPGSAGRRDRG